ncbi:hypothetical protein BV25DRAFT_119859 [Artomyces pyxidatus]|uniref:Uncharacterized protein n=1 Tax=Artomyces pyxidatus TaxID=48021 RepID=A0ACB8TLH4_9AGAM|nr:hypothetical protein BV25DRAFT_119859 [Artomyces pyxidatus]
MAAPLSDGPSGIGSKPCRWYQQGHCRYGLKCKFRHDSVIQGTNVPIGVGDTPRTSRVEPQSDYSVVLASPVVLAASSSNIVFTGESTKPGPFRPKRGELPCYAWKAGNCAKGAKCWFAHDPEVQDGERRRQENRAKQAAARQARLTQESDVRARKLREEHKAAERHQAKMEERARHEIELEAQREKEAERRRQEEEEERVRQEAQRLIREEERRLAQERAREERERVRKIREAEKEARLAELAKEEAAQTTQTVILGSIVTFGAGMDVRNIITGFESCTVRVKNLPLNARLDEVAALFTQQGIDAGRFQIVGMKKTPDGKQAADVVADGESGGALAAGLDDIEFRDERLSFEVGPYNSPGGMGMTSTDRDVDVLTMSWHGPSSMYVAEYDDMEQAQRKVRELDGMYWRGRRLKVQINTLPPGRYVSNFRPNSIKIMNLLPSASDEDVMTYCGSSSVRRLRASDYDLDTALQTLRTWLNHISPVQDFTQSSTGDTTGGVISVRARFTSHDEAQKVSDTLVNNRFHWLGNSNIWTRLPTPMQYTLIIPVEQYRAQRAQWQTLKGNIKDKAACSLSVHELHPVRIRLSGSMKQAVGALKVRVENLAGGEKVEGWHSSFGVPGFPLWLSILQETGAFVRADWRKQVLKVYGEPRSVEQARAAVKAELDRLASLEWTVILKKSSVSFFLRHGVPALKETFGEDSVKFVASTRKITITGGEDVRHTFDRLVQESLSGHGTLPVSAGQLTCPICYDDVSSPERLGCGHIYCTACIRHFLMSALDSDQFPLVCMGDESRCGVPIAIPAMFKFLPRAAFDRLMEIAFVAHVAKHPQELRYCKTPDCTQIYRTTGAASPSVLQCPSCFSTVCSSCDEEGHEGVTCEMQKALKDPAEQDRLNDEWITQQGGRVKKCPQCNLLIEKTEGCNHMSCRCGAHICWRCMGIFEAGTIYRHMHSAHGGIHDDTPNNPVPNADYAQQEELLRQVAQRRQLAALEAVRREEDVRRREEVARREREALRQQAELRRQTEARVRQFAAYTQPQVQFVAANAEARTRERLRQAEERSRREREEGGWCMIM